MSRSASDTESIKQSCCGVSGYHRHCVICHKVLRDDQRVFCGRGCANYDKQQRLRLRSIRCWIEIDGKKVRRWIPKRFVERSKSRGYLGRQRCRATQG